MLVISFLIAKSAIKLVDIALENIIVNSCTQLCAMPL